MSEEKYSIVANNISKCYKMYCRPEEKFLDLLLPKGAGKDFYALKDISFKIKSGDSVGIIGLNGSGKSTLSNIIGGVSMPTKGTININGESSLIAIGVGLNNFLTGIENIELKATMMGYRKSGIEKIKQDIIEFADIGEFITQPIRTYSSGMKSRLGFAISVYTNPDILVIDEALAVGDPTFTRKCLEKMNEFKARGKTIFLVSHSTSQIKKFCNKAMWLEYGALKAFGEINEVIPLYEEYIQSINSMSSEDKKDYKNMVLRIQEHALLTEFKTIDPKFKEISKNGKIINKVYLVNKNGDIKLVPYNIDIYTIAFGFLPSIFRGRILTTLVTLALQVANVFIVRYPFNLLTNIALTLIFSLFTGKQYVRHLVDNKGYMDYTVRNKYKLQSENNVSKRDKEEAGLVQKNNFNMLATILSILFILLVPTGIYLNIDNYNIDMMTYFNSDVDLSEQETFKGKVGIVITETDTEGIESIYSIAVLATAEKKRDLEVSIYSLEQVAEFSEMYDNLRNIDLESKENHFKSVFKEYFDIDVTDYVVINSNDYGIELNKYPNLNMMYSENFLEFFQGDEREVNYRKNKIVNSKTSLKLVNIDEFYNKFKGLENVSVVEVREEVEVQGEDVGESE